MGRTVVVVASLALGLAAPAAAQGTLPGEPAPPAASDMQHLSTEDALKTAIDWAKWGKQPESGKVIDTAIAAISVGYPPAGIALGFAKGLITAMGGGTDPVGDALKALESRLTELQGRVDTLQREVAQIRDAQFKQANLDRLDRLLERRDEVTRMWNRLRQRPTDRYEKNNIALDAAVTADRFLADTGPGRDLWQWSDMRVFTDQRTGQLASQMLPADFKTLPTFEYYVSAIVLWLSALEYASDGNATYVTGNPVLVKQLLRHAAYLSVRPLWHELADEPETLPEQVMRRISCDVEPVGKYPTNLVCGARHVCADVMRRTRATVGTTTFTVPTANTLCTLAMRVPRPVSAAELASRTADLGQNPRYGADALALWQQWDAPRVVANEDALERDYGVEAMGQLADRIVRVAKYGTTREQYIGSFDMTFHYPQYLYGVKANGEMLQFIDDMIVDRNPPKASPGVAQTLSPGVRESIASGTAVAKPAAPAAPAPSPTEKRMLTDKNVLVSPRSSTVLRPGPSAAAQAIKATLPPTPRVVHKLDGPRLAGGGWQAYSLILPAGRSGMYAMTPDGVLRWFRHDGFVQGTPQWKGPVQVGTGWHAATKVVAGGDGVLYAIFPDGRLRWYRHLDFADATAPPRWSVRWVGTGWTGLAHVFSGGDGIIYAVPPDGRLMWYRHKGFLTGAVDWEGPKEVGNAGWAYFKRLFSPGDGIIYAILPEGDLLWYQHEGYQDGTPRWQPGGRPTRLAADWRDFVQVLPLMFGKSSEPVVK
jgi:hypothetical protein